MAVIYWSPVVLSLMVFTIHILPILCLSFIPLSSIQKHLRVLFLRHLNSSSVHSLFVLVVQDSLVHNFFYFDFNFDCMFRDPDRLGTLQTLKNSQVHCTMGGEGKLMIYLVLWKPFYCSDQCSLMIQSGWSHVFKKSSTTLLAYNGENDLVLYNTPLR